MSPRIAGCALIFSVVLAACGAGNNPASLETVSQPTQLRASVAATAPGTVNLLAAPGFEGNTGAWIESLGNYGPIVTVDAANSHSGSAHAWLGGYDSANDVLYQDVAISAGASKATLQYWYNIRTNETTTTGAYDTLKVELYSVASGALLATLRSYSNLDRTAGWIQSSAIDLSAYKGQTVRLKFTGRTDAASTSSFLIDDVELLVQEGSTAPAVSTTFDGSIPPIFPGKRADYNIAVNSDGSVTVTDRVGGGGIQVFLRAKRLVFSDIAVALDIDGTSGQVFRLYQAAFTRLPDLGGLGFQIGAVENLGASYNQVAQGFINSPEFSAKYGNLSNTQFVTLLYANVLGRAPDSGGLAFHVSHLDGTNPDKITVTRAQVLGGFSESPENKALTLPAMQSGMEFVPMAGNPACGAGKIVSNGVCGAAAQGCTLPQVLQAGACVVPAAGMTVYVASGSATSASTLITTRSGSAIAYFTAAGGRVPSQALVTSSGGKATRVYYGKDGALQKIVNQKTGEYLSIKMRSDVLGADYLLFNSSGKFQSGYTLYRSGSDWFQARVLGDFGQFTGNFSGAVSGSFALKSPRLVYASPTRLDPRLSQILNGEFAQSLSFGAGVLDLLIPSAHAIGLNPLDKGNLYSGMALMIMGGVLGGPSNPAGALLMVGGAVQIYRGLAGNLDRNIESISQSVTQIMEDHAANDLASGTEPVASMNNSLVGILARGFNSLKDKVTAKLDRLSGGFGGQPAPQSAPDTSVASQPLPFVAEDHTPLEGSMVDTQNRIYNATGTINANGEFSASGDSSDKLKLNIAGKVEPGKTTSTACAQTNASGQTLKTCTVAPGSVVEPIGVCQTSTQSGGNGTFSYAYNLGASEGSFNLSYDMYSIADAMTVVGGGRVLFTTNGLVSGSRSMTVTYSGGASAIVNLSAPTSGTQWTFTVGCGS